jgi:hypothetical protein
VTFHYKTDTKGTPQFGLTAEEVAKVNPALVLPDKEGKPYTLNEFLESTPTDGGTRGDHFQAAKAN